MIPVSAYMRCDVAGWLTPKAQLCPEEEGQGWLAFTTAAARALQPSQSGLHQKAEVDGLKGAASPKKGKAKGSLGRARACSCKEEQG